MIIQTANLEKVSRQSITAAEVTRVLERTPVTHEPYPSTTISPSIIYDLDIAQFVMDYYAPAPQESPWKKDMYVSHGHAAERIIQHRLFQAGVLDCPHSTFQETTVWCPELKVKGRVDGILFKENLKYEGAKNQEKAKMPEGESTRIILEIKETSDYGYGLIKTPSDIPMKFQWAQAIYQHILGVPETMFLYVNRDSMSLKTMFFSSPESMVEKVIDKIQKIWYHVENKIIPTKDGDVKFES